MYAPQAGGAVVEGEDDEVRACFTTATPHAQALNTHVRFRTLTRVCCAQESVYSDSGSAQDELGEGGGTPRSGAHALKQPRT
jgi:hypothetical protein